MRYMNQYRQFSRRSRTVFWIILAAMILIGLVAFFTSEIGRTVALVCCGGIVLLIVVGALSERGMSRPR
jgi:4-hydroxybenzoate polyprenyltransferase